MSLSARMTVDFPELGPPVITNQLVDGGIHKDYNPKPLNQIWLRGFVPEYITYLCFSSFEGFPGSTGFTGETGFTGSAGLFSSAGLVGFTGSGPRAATADLNAIPAASIAAL